MIGDEQTIQGESFAVSCQNRVVYEFRKSEPCVCFLSPHHDFQTRKDLNILRRPEAFRVAFRDFSRFLLASGPRHTVQAFMPSTAGGCSFPKNAAGFVPFFRRRLILG
ncbi:hypothetical protein [Prosthecochloris sp. GSB1]|uniref:hypothetical protein n=1 Tax=Prosthecochloris sp. GSB1 TaxID=281093 RepID=UPI00142E6D3B|nr:hypothetical protein [Prosthecochloris sp. GSB1]